MALSACAPSRIAAALLCAQIFAAPPSLAKKPKDTAAVVDPKKKEQVKRLFEEGMNLYDLGKYSQAITAFETAFTTLPDPVFLYNIAQAHRMAGNTKDAISFYRTYLRKVPDAPNAGEVKDWIAQLEKGPQKPFVVAPPSPPPLPPLPPAQPYLEPKSKHTFMTRMTYDKKDYVLTGVGYRTYIGFLLYSVAMYVEEEPARRAFPKLVEKAGGSDLAQLRARDLAQNFVILGEFGKIAVLYFARDLKAKQIRESYRDMLKGNLRPEVAPMLRQHTEQFLDLFGRDVKAGETMYLQTTTEGQIIVTVGDDKRVGPPDPTLCIDLWNLWLGTKPISEGLKQGLVERIQALK
jgi:tetratricopeptide (TPR) repeat protein